MLKNLFRNFFPKAPPSIPPAAADQVEVLKAIITALASHVQKDGDRILAVKVPGYTGVVPDHRFTVSGIADFAVETGLDAHGSNVLIEVNPYRPAPPTRPPEFTANTIALALNEMVANSASAVVTAEAISDSAAKPA